MALDRVDGFAPLGAYAALGDGRTVALVATDGAVDWWAIPALDAAPACAAILDPAAGGAITLAPTVPYESSRRYVDATNVVETTFRTATGTVRVTDALNVGGAGRLPWTELARRVQAEDGAVPMHWQVRPGRRFGSTQPWSRLREDVPVLTVGDQQLAVVTAQLGTPTSTGHSVEAAFTARPGQRGLLAVVATDGEPLHVPSAEQIQSRIDRTISAWQRWCADLGYDGRWRDAVVRSALALKLLTFEPTGAIAAAATTSLPEQVGGERNFDYRFAWIRDASFALDALSRLGLTEEVHRSLSWLLAAAAQTAPELHIFYTVHGQVAPATMQDVPQLTGYRGSLPVHVGNSAASQTQLGAYGDLLDAVWRYTRHGGQLDLGTGTMLAGLADRTCDIWPNHDAGLWELGQRRPYTSSKLGCWVALDRAIRLADSGQLTAGSVARWRLERDNLRRYIDEACWSPAKQAYTFYAGSDDLDAAVLLVARTGFCAGDDPRLNTTIDAIRAELTADGPLLYRYTGMREKEGAFLACSFWLVEALAHAGRLAEATELLDQALAHGNDVGLLTEEIDPTSGDLLGNIPQGLSHLAVIGAATALTTALAGQ